MLKPQVRTAILIFLASSLLAASPGRLQAQTYPIDCAILLCLSGGWPASVPCTKARAEFIRRITPWPVEPPLQIWRCPMGASLNYEEEKSALPKLYDILFEHGGSILPHSIPVKNFNSIDLFAPAVIQLEPKQTAKDQMASHIWPILDRADIDISGPEFNFVRSIRVFDVRLASQRRFGREGECERTASVYLGSYGIQGDFAWRRSSISALPSAHRGLESFGRDCPGIYHRSVFVEWRDYEGNYDYEQVNY